MLNNYKRSTPSALTISSRLGTLQDLVTTKLGSILVTYHLIILLSFVIKLVFRLLKSWLAECQRVTLFVVLYAGHYGFREEYRLCLYITLHLSLLNSIFLLHCFVKVSLACQLVTVWNEDILPYRTNIVFFLFCVKNKKIW